jgi:hypothetical protein
VNVVHTGDHATVSQGGGVAASGGSAVATDEGQAAAASEGSAASAGEESRASVSTNKHPRQSSFFVFAGVAFLLALAALGVLAYRDVLTWKQAATAAGVVAVAIAAVQLMRR